ncbi:MAG: hypothetical protein ABIJ48_06590 [Actinomycetota bacterium]
MTGAEGHNERFGKVLRITALVATLVALAAVIGPRLASSGGGGSTVATAAAWVPAEATPAATPTWPTVPAARLTTAPPVTTTTAPAVVFPVTPVEDGGAVDLALAGTHAGRYGPERAGFFAGDTIGWRFQVTNSGEEYLWGVFVYLELYGPVTCASRRLEVGASTECWAETNALVPTSGAEAWVTAWTEARMVGDRLSHRVGTAVG